MATQLVTDLVAVTVMGRLGYPVPLVLAHVLCVVGLVLLAALPSLLASPYLGLSLAIVVYGIGGGLLLDGETVTFAGTHYQVTDHTIHPRPVQRPRPPIFVGGNAARVLRLAARKADIVGCTGINFMRGVEPEVSGFRPASVMGRSGSFARLPASASADWN